MAEQWGGAAMAGVFGGACNTGWGRAPFPLRKQGLEGGTCPVRDGTWFVGHARSLCMEGLLPDDILAERNNEYACPLWEPEQARMPGCLFRCACWCTRT
jgi:hypothetical protein